ncbi:LPXTG-motif cell wall-anchored protein [Paenibacillus sp. DS2015]|uniref:collagen binding domain-containing protein n=1 Tax=Paenibacillus sp. DS2015 TaxID=3373917 RepID=UPI003D1E1FDC
MRKKISVTIITMILMLHSILGVGINQVSAEDVTLGSNTLNRASLAAAQPSILTKVTLTDNAGTVIDAVYNPDQSDRTKLGSAVRIEYEWKLDNNHSFKDGSTFEFDIPQEFKIYNDFGGPLTVDGEKVGDFTVNTSGHVTMLFNEFIENHSNVTGTLEVHTELNKDTIKGDANVLIPFQVQGGTQVVEVNIKPDKGQLLSKDGVADKAKKIDWTIDVNTSLDKVENAVITDDTPQGLLLDPSTFSIISLIVNVDGSTVLGGPIDPSKYSYETEPDGSSYKLTFKDLSINSAYRLQYSTMVTGEVETSFTNIANLTGSKSATAQAKEDIIREKLLTKTSGVYDKVNQIVSWEVKYNFGEKQILSADTWIEDRFDSRMKLVSNSLEVFDDKGVLLNGSEYTFTPLASEVNGKLGFDLNFESDIDTAYTIKYQTQYIERVYADTNVNNTVTAKSGESATVAHKFVSVIGSKSNGSTNYSAKTTQWNIVFNSDKKPMSNAVVKDTFTNGGLEFLPNTLKITDSSGSSVTAATYTVINDDPRLGFEIQFNGTINDKYSISYETKYNDDWFFAGKSSYINAAGINWDENSQPDSVKMTATFTPNAYTKNNGTKVGRYDASNKEITWDIKANYNRKTILDAIITDQLQKGQTLDLNSIEVYKMNVPAGGEPTHVNTPLDASEYVVKYVDDELRIELGDIDSAYWITFKTKFEVTLVEKKIPNEAVLSSDTTVLAEWATTVNTLKDEVKEYVTKEGIINGSLINWTIKINEVQSYVTNVKILDTPSSNQILVENSFHLYAANVASGGAISQGVELTKGIDYEIVIEKDAKDQQKFVLSFTGPISSAFILKYDSEIAVSADKEKVTNSVSFEGDGFVVGSENSNIEIEVRTSGGSGSGIGERGSIEITKVDKDDPSQGLEGATFILYEKGKKNTAIEKTTDIDGKIVFTKLLYKTYTLEETNTPVGYEIGNAEQDITIDSTIKQSGSIKKVTVTNSKIQIPPTGSLEIIKVDKADPTKLLEGATFVLQDAGKKRAAITQVTDALGKAVFTQLLYDDYILEEIIAPVGYDIDEATRTITIDSSIEQDASVKREIVTNTQSVVTPPVTPGGPSTPPVTPGGPSTPPVTPGGPSTPPVTPGGPSTPPVTPSEPSPSPVTPSEPSPSPVTPSEPSPSPVDGKNNGTQPTTVKNPSDIELDDDGNPLGGSSGDQADGGKGNGDQEASDSNPSGVAMLPKTGESSNLPYYLSGFALILLGILFRKKWLSHK